MVSACAAAAARARVDATISFEPVARPVLRTAARTDTRTLARVQCLAATFLRYSKQKMMMKPTHRGETYAKVCSWYSNNDPHPPFRAGSPQHAGEHITGEILSLLAPGIASARNAARTMASRFSRSFS
jgi:hypothetical protein